MRRGYSSSSRTADQLRQPSKGPAPGGTVSKRYRIRISTRHKSPKVKATVDCCFARDGEEPRLWRVLAEKAFRGRCAVKRAERWAEKRVERDEARTWHEVIDR